MRIYLNLFSRKSFIIKRDSCFSLVRRPNLEIPEEHRSQVDFCCAELSSAWPVEK